MVMSGEPILSRELFIMIITFRMSLILPKLIVQRDSALIEEIPDPIPPSGKEKGTPKLDFPLGL